MGFLTGINKNTIQEFVDPNYGRKAETFKEPELSKMKDWVKKELEKAKKDKKDLEDGKKREIVMGEDWTLQAIKAKEEFISLLERFNNEYIKIKNNTKTDLAEAKENQEKEKKIAKPWVSPNLESPKKSETPKTKTLEYNFNTASEITGNLTPKQIKDLKAGDKLTVNIKNRDSHLRLRNSEGKIIDELIYGSKVTYLGDTKNLEGYTFIKVKIGDKEGWVAADYMKIVKRQIKSKDIIDDKTKASNKIGAKVDSKTKQIENKKIPATSKVSDDNKIDSIQSDQSRMLEDQWGSAEMGFGGEENIFNTEKKDVLKYSWASVGYSVEGANYIIGKNGEAKLITYEELTQENREKLEKYSKVLIKVENIKLLLSALDQENKDVQLSNIFLEEKLKHFDLNNIQTLNNIENIIANIFNNFLNIDNKNTINISNRISVLNYIRDELDNSDLIRNQIIERNFADLTEIDDDLIINLIDNPTNGYLGEVIRDLFSKDEIKELRKDILNKKNEANTYFIDNKEQLITQFPGKTEKEIEELIISSFVANYTKSLIMTKFIEKKQSDYWTGYNGDNKEIALFSDIEGIGVTDISDKTIGWGEEAFLLVATEIAALAAGALTMGAGALLVNTAVYGTRGYKGISALQKAGRLANAPLKHKQLVGTGSLLGAKVGRFAAMSTIEGGAFYAGYGAAQSGFEGKYMYTLEGLGESVAFMGAFRALRGMYKIVGWELKSGESILKQPKNLSRQLALDTVALSALGLGFEGVLFEPGEWSAETFLQAFAMAILLKGAGRISEKATLRFTNKGGKVGVQEKVTPKAKTQASEGTKVKDGEKITNTSEQARPQDGGLDSSLKSYPKYEGLKTTSREESLNELKGRISLFRSLKETTEEAVRKWKGKKEIIQDRLNTYRPSITEARINKVAEQLELSRVKGVNGRPDGKFAEYADRYTSKYHELDGLNIHGDARLTILREFDKQLSREILETKAHANYKRGKEKEIQEIDQHINELNQRWLSEHNNKLRYEQEFEALNNSNYGFNERISQSKIPKSGNHDSSWGEHQGIKGKPQESNTTDSKTPEQKEPGTAKEKAEKSKSASYEKMLEKDINSLKTGESTTYGEFTITKKSNGEYQVKRGEGILDFKNSKGVSSYLGKEIQNNTKRFETMMSNGRKEVNTRLQRLNNKDLIIDSKTFRIEKDGDGFIVQKKGESGGYEKVEIGKLSEAEINGLLNKIIGTNGVSALTKATEKLSINNIFTKSEQNGINSKLGNKGKEQLDSIFKSIKTSGSATKNALMWALRGQKEKFGQYGKVTVLGGTAIHEYWEYHKNPQEYLNDFETLTGTGLHLLGTAGNALMFRQIGIIRYMVYNELAEMGYNNIFSDSSEETN